VASDPLEFAFLQHPQQLDLYDWGNLPNFVEKQRATMGQLEPPSPLPQGTGERALFMTEQLRFQQRFRQCCATYLDERMLATGAVLMKGIGDQLFSRAALAQDQDRRIGPRHGFDLVQDAAHLGVGAENDVEAKLALQRFLQVLVFTAQRDDASDPFDDQEEFVHLEGLRDVIEGPQLHGT